MEAYNTISAMIDIVHNVHKEKEVSHKDRTNFNRLLMKADRAYLKKKHALIAWNNMLNAFEKEFFDKAVKHAQKLSGQIRPVANDMPFKVGDKVSVIRHEHGWHDGRMEAIIRKAYQNGQGIWSYSAQVVRFEDDEEFDNDHFVEINHTRDAHLTN